MAASSDYMRNYRTPPSSRRKRPRRSSTSSRFNSAVDTLAGMAADASGYGPAYRGGKLAFSAAKKMFKGKRKLAPAKKGYSGYTRYAGSVKKGKKFSKKISKNGQLTEYGITNKGIQTHFEFRKTMTGTNVEGVFIGHTSLPGKQSGINMWRAILKYLLIKIGVEVRDFGKRMFDYGFGNFDQIVVYWYELQTQTSPYTNIATINTTTSFDNVAAQLAGNFATSSDLFNSSTMRLDSIVYIPVNSPNPESTAKLGRGHVNLNCASVAVSTVSKLKIQNVTVESPNDNEADDVTRVPLQGRVYNCKGNNLEFKSNRNCLPGFFDGSDEVALCQTFTKASSSFFGGNVQNFYGDDTQTPYVKTSEMPQAWEITNCNRSGKFTLQPGDIKVSTVTNRFTVSINYLFRLLYQSRVGKVGTLGYNPKAGKTTAMYLEKVIGRGPTVNNSVTLWAELEFKQTMCVTGKMNTYTLPITYQVDFAT